MLSRVRMRGRNTCGYATRCCILTQCCNFTRLHWVKVEVFFSEVVMIMIEILQSSLKLLGNQGRSSTVATLVVTK